MSGSEGSMDDFTSFQKFAIGGFGGFLPIMVSLLAVDIAPLIDNPKLLTLGNYCGYFLRVLILFLLGGTIALLNNEVKKPLTIVQLGVAAPALITAWINGTGLPSFPARQQAWISLIHSAHAEAITTNKLDATNAQFSIDLLRGLTQSLPSLVAPPREVQNEQSKGLNLNPKQYIQFSVRKKTDGSCFETILPSKDKYAQLEIMRKFPPEEYIVEEGRCKN